MQQKLIVMLIAKAFTELTSVLAMCNICNKIIRKAVCIIQLTKVVRVHATVLDQLTAKTKYLQGGCMQAEATLSMLYHCSRPCSTVKFVSNLVVHEELLYKVMLYSSSLLI